MKIWVLATSCGSDDEAATLAAFLTRPTVDTLKNNHFLGYKIPEKVAVELARDHSAYDYDADCGYVIEALAAFP